MTLPTASTATVRAYSLLAASSSALDLTPPPKPTLAELLATAPIPWTLAALAVRLEIDLALFDRIKAGRQPMPRVLARRIASLAGLAVGSVEAIVTIVDDATPSAFRPVPADPAWGDVLDFAPLARTVEVTP